MILVDAKLQCDKCGKLGIMHHFVKADSYNVGGVPKKCSKCDGNMVIIKITKQLVRKDYES